MALREEDVTGSDEAIELNKETKARNPQSTTQTQ